MIIVYSFIGKLPKYIIDTVHQSRLFFDGDIYLILDELNSKYLKKLEKYNVILIDYKEVTNNSFNKMYRKNKNKFTEYKFLGNRKMLLTRCCRIKVTTQSNINLNTKAKSNSNSNAYNEFLNVGEKK